MARSSRTTAASRRGQPRCALAGNPAQELHARAFPRLHGKRRAHAEPRALVGDDRRPVLHVGGESRPRSGPLRAASRERKYSTTTPSQPRSLTCGILSQAFQPRVGRREERELPAAHDPAVQQDGGELALLVGDPFVENRRQVVGALPDPGGDGQDRGLVDGHHAPKREWR